MSRSPDRLDLVLLVGFSDCRKTQDLPRLLPEHVADEVVLMQSLHDDDNGPVTLVVEPAVEGVEEPIVRCIPSCVGQRLLRFRGIVDQNEIGAAPGQYPAGGGGEPISLAGW
jgi:hypothetical protein